MNAVTGSANILVLTELFRCYLYPSCTTKRFAHDTESLMLLMTLPMWYSLSLPYFQLPQTGSGSHCFNYVCWSMSLHTVEYAASWGSAASVVMLHSGLWQRWASQKTTLCTLQRRMRYTCTHLHTYVRMSNNPIPWVLISEKRMRSENSFLTDEDPGLGRNVSIK